MEDERALYASINDPVPRKPRLRGSQFLDTAEQQFAQAAQTVQGWAEDREGIGDDITRLGLGGVKNIAKVASLPGVSHALRVAGAPAWAAGQAIGAGLEHGLGVDPRYGHIAGEALDLAVGAGALKIGGKAGKMAAVKGAHNLIKTDLPGSQIAAKGLQRHYLGKAADLKKNRLRTIREQVGGQSQAMREGNLNLQAVMDKFEPAQWQVQYQSLPDVKSRERYLKRGFGRGIKDLYVEGGKITPKALAKDSDTMQKLMDRADRLIDGFVKGDQRKLYDQASWNIFDEAKEVYGTGLVKKVQAAFLGVQGKQWHHMFGNKEAGEFLLNAVAQDPVVAANLFKHMEGLNLKSGAIAENMALMRAAPHNSWHRFMEDMGIEPRVKMKPGETLEQLKNRNLLAQQTKSGGYLKTAERVSKSTGKNQPWKYTAPLDVSDFGHAIAEGIQNGTTDINELFTFLTVYHKKYVPWMKQQLQDPKYAAQFLTDLPDGPEKALLLGLYETKVGTRGRKPKSLKIKGESK